MPLLKRKPHELCPAPAGLKPDERVFVVRSTGEVFKDYETYLKQVHAYRAKQWQCKFTGKTNLSYQEALDEERRSTELLKDFPKDLEGPFLKAVHHSTLKLDELVSVLYDQPGKENDQQEPAASAAAAAAASAKKARPAVKKTVIRRWVQEVADCTDRLWTAKPEYAKKHGLESEVPEAIQKQLAELRSKIRTPGSQSKAHAAEKKALHGGLPSPVKPADLAKAAKPAKSQILRSLEEEEKRLKPGTVKHIAFMVLKEFGGTQGLPLREICRFAAEKGMKEDWEDKNKTHLATVLRADYCFCRVAKDPVGKGFLYTLRAIPGVVPMPDLPPAAEAGPSADATAAAAAAAAAAGAAEGPSLAGDAPKPAKAEQDPLAKAELTASICRSAVERRKAALDKAEAAHKELAARVAEEKEKISLGTPTKAAKAAASPAKASPSAGTPSFELSEDLREYRGDPNDRKALMEFKRRQEAEKGRLARLKEDWDRQQRKNQANLSRHMVPQLQQSALALEAARKAYTDSLAVMANAEKAVHRERQRADKGREKLEAKLEAEREKERRKADPLHGRKFPIDDLELLELLREKAARERTPAPAEDVFSVPEMPGDEGGALADLLLVSDFLQQFAKQLGLPGKAQQLGFAELEAAIVASLGQGADADADAACSAAAPGAGAGAAAIPPAALLSVVYQKLLGLLLEEQGEEGGAGRLVQRWQAVLGPVTWPEVLRRYVQSWDERESSELVRPLGAGEVDGVDRATHARLLRLLVDEVMASESVRAVLSKRLEEAMEKAAELRADMAEDRKRIKEIDDAAREVKKRRKEEELAQQQQAGGDGGGAPGAATAGGEEESLELPEALREFKGGSRKEQLEWRQEQGKAVKALEKKKAALEAKKAREEKAREAAARQEAAEERQRERERLKAEEALAASQEALERELDRLAVRRVPLGTDRCGRRYWWGLAGHKAGLLVEGVEGGWAMMAAEEEVEKLIASLDARGVRECELKKALEKALPAISQTLKKAREAREGGGADKARKEKKEVVKGLPPERVQPSRRGKPVDLKEEPGAAKAKEAKADAERKKLEQQQRRQRDEALASDLGPEGARRAALSFVVEQLDAVAEAAAKAKAPCPAGGWKGWRSELAELHGDIEAAAAQAAGPGGDGGAALAQVMAALRERLVLAEEMVAGWTGDLEALAKAEEKEKAATARAVAADEAAGDGADADASMDVDFDDGKDEEESDVEMLDDEEEAGGKESAGKHKAKPRHHVHNHHHRSSLGHAAAQAFEDADEEVDSDADEAEVAKGKQERLLWRSRRERQSWRACVEAACSTPRLAYCAAVLLHLAKTPLAKGKGKLPSRLSALGLLPLRAPLAPGGGKKSARDKGPKRTAQLSKDEATGCSLLKGQADPKLKADSEYPEWLWKLLDPRPSASELQQAYQGQGLNMEQLQRLYRLKNKQAINSANELTSKK